MRPLIAIAFASLLTGPGLLSAQIAAPAPPAVADEPATPEAGSEAAAAATGAVADGTAPTEASLNLAAFIASRSAALSIATRNLDPFGLPKNPSIVPEPEVEPEESERPRPGPVADAARKSLIADALEGLRPSMTGEGFFIHQGTTYRVNDTFSAQHNETVLSLSIASISPNRIVFEDAATGIRHAVALGAAAPSGLTPRRPGAAPPGISPGSR